MRKEIMIMSAVCLTAVAAHGEYTLKVSNGKWPEGVTVENVNGNIPIEKGYKNGWTDKGWTSGDYGTTRNVLLSPSYLAENETCESALTLPILTIEPGEWLFWKSRAVYPLRNELHTVEIRRNGEEHWIELARITDSGLRWEQRMADLSDYAGEECQVRIVSRSEKGYMLALHDLHISKPSDFSFEALNKTPKFFGADDTLNGCISVDISVRNLGKPISGVAIKLVANGESATETGPSSTWHTDEIKQLSLQLPISINERIDYKIIAQNENGEEQTIDENFAFLSSMKRNLLVDKGTGMWCNNCPVGTLEIEDLERTYGEALITVETHNGDPLANDIYFNWLGYRSIPRLELDRNKSTSGETSKYFKDYICLPTEIGIKVTGITVNDDSTLSVTADTSTSDLFSDTDRTYRIGYVLTRDVAGDENLRFYQTNNCAISNYCQYYYLPSTIWNELCNFPNTSLPSPLASNSDDVAFTGIEGSLPNRLEAAKTYTVNWNIPLPTGYESFQGMRLVAYVLDEYNRKVLNSTFAMIDDYSEVETIDCDGNVKTTDVIFSIDGRCVGKSKESLAPGIYIINGKKVKL